MATTELFLDLSRLDDWITEDNKASAISGSYEQKQNNQPRVVWSLNAIPFSGGVKSLTPTKPRRVSYFPSAPQISNMWELRSLLDDSGNLTYFLLDDSVEGGTFRKYWYWDGAIYNWRLLVEDSVGIYHFFHRKFTVFQNKTLVVFTNGDTFGGQLTIQGGNVNADGVFILDIPSSTVQLYNLTGISISGSNRKNGITSFQNYLLFWDKDTIYWSSPLDFTDFTPAIGGGGSTKISEAKGDVITIVPNPTGLMIYCKLNVVHAAFSGDSSNPWVFNEVPNAAGILMEDGNPMVTTSETSEFQVYANYTGISAITPNGAQLLDPKVLEFINDGAIELKDVGTTKITHKEFISGTDSTARDGARSSKLYDLIMIGNDLFIFVGNIQCDSSEYKDNRLYMYNTITRKIAKFDGTYQGMHPNLNLYKDIDDGKDLYNKVDAFPSQYATSKRAQNGIRVPIVIDAGQNGDRKLGLFDYVDMQLRESEIFVGHIQLNRSKTTIIHRIKPEGTTTGEVITGEPVERMRVFVYSASVLGEANPIEYIYNPADDAYYGYAEGKDLTIECRGFCFYLTGLRVEVAAGGDF